MKYLISIVLGLVMPMNALAASDTFIKIDGIDAEVIESISRDDGRVVEVEVVESTGVVRSVEGQAASTVPSEASVQIVTTDEATSVEVMQTIGAEPVTTMKESKEKGGTADINIGLGELQEGDKDVAVDTVVQLAPAPEAAHADSFFDIFIDTGDDDTRAAADVFIKIGDIKGETEPDAADPSIQEITNNTETANAKKPKEIVVVGSKVRVAAQSAGVSVRGWDPVKKEVTSEPEDIQTGKDFVDYIGVSVLADEHIEEVRFDNAQITMSYTQPAQLFGIFTIDMTVEAELSEEGGVKVKFPWYKVLASDNEKGLRAALDVAFRNDTTQENQSDSALLRARAERFNILRSTLQSSYDTQMPADR